MAELGNIPVDIVSDDVANNGKLVDPIEDSESPLDAQTQANYRYWKKNTPYLYDYLMTYPLVWPSLTVQFFPDLEWSFPKTSLGVPENSVDDDYTNNTRTAIQRLLVGTFTLGQAVDSVSILQLPYYTNLGKNLSMEKLDYNQDKKEFEITKLTKKKISVLQKINHLGDVNKARYMPQKPDVLACCSSLGEIVIYDRTKHSNFKNTLGDDTDISKPELRLVLQTQESVDIFALDWNPNNEGVLCGGRMDGEIDIFDLKKSYSSKDVNSIEAMNSYKDKKGINDIQWMPQHDSIFTCVNEDGYFKLYDTRNESKAPVISAQCSHVGVNCVSLNQGNAYCIATGDNSGVIDIWDMRKLNMGSTHSIKQIKNQHTASITQLKWHHKFHNVLASSSGDRSVKIFALDKESNEGLIFNHSGHMLGVNDFDWSSHDDWLTASVADDNTLHIWKPAKAIIQKYKSS